jgi:hypothetical protein
MALSTIISSRRSGIDRLCSNQSRQKRQPIFSMDRDRSTTPAMRRDLAERSTRSRHDFLNAARYLRFALTLMLNG